MSKAFHIVDVYIYHPFLRFHPDNGDYAVSAKK